MGLDDADHDGLHHRVQLRRGGDAAGRNDPAVPLPTADTTVQACDRRARPRCRERHHPTDHRVCRRRAGGAGESGVSGKIFYLDRTPQSFLSIVNFSAAVTFVHTPT